MKIFIMTDLEGPRGVVARPSTNGSHQHEITNYAEAGQLLTKEVNACATGLFDAGAKDVIAIDGHGGGNAFPHTLLDSRVAAGSLGGIMYPRSFGLDASFNAAIQIGAHGMNGRKGFLSHTFSSGQIVEMRLNGELIGEVGIEILLAAYFGVPTILISGDATCCKEAMDFLGYEIPHVITKDTTYRYTVINRPIGEVHRELALQAKYALEHLSSFPVKVMKKGFEITVKWMNINSADDCERRGATRLDDTTVSWQDDDFLEVWAQQQGWAPKVHSARFPELHAQGVWK